MKKALLLCSVILLFTQCSNKSKLEKALMGEFVVYEFNYKKIDYSRNMDLNLIEFYSNGNLKTPGIFSFKDSLDSFPENYVESGTWKIVDDNNSFILRMTSQNIW